MTSAEKRKITIVYCLLIVLMIFLFMLSISTGSVMVPFSNVTSVLINGTGDNDTVMIIKMIRLPRTVLALVSGGALALAVGIAIQNFPEGAIISMPLHAEGKSKGKAFAGGFLSGAVEPVGALLTILSARLFLPVMPYLLSFAAGAMIYVVVEELIPEMSEGEHSNIGVIMFSVGFTLMMILDVALG